MKITGFSFKSEAVWMLVIPAVLATLGILAAIIFVLLRAWLAER
jgi:hypothetical protein